MKPEKKSSHSIYDDNLIVALLLQHKVDHDGLSPTIRGLLEMYGDITGKYMSTSIMIYHLDKICRTKGWTKTIRGIETNGEWLNDNNNS